jgi:hypothetical protein
MPDGAYLELLSFTHPESHYPPSSPSRDARRHQPWANKSCGWVAYSFLGAPHATPRLSELLNERLDDAGSTTRYAAEVAGGRARPKSRVDARGRTASRSSGRSPRLRGGRRKRAGRACRSSAGT